MKRGVRKMSTRTLVLLSCVVGMTVLVLALASCALFNKFPSAGFTIGPSTTGPAPFTVTLSGAPSSDPDGEIKTYSWDFGDGAQGTGRSVTHTYTAVGTYTIILTVTDNWDATDEAAKTVYVTAAEPAGPTASFTASPTSGTSPLTVSFDASASTYVGGAISSYEWAFGDTGTWTGKTAQHTYFSSGSKTFTVTLTVRGTDNRTGTVTKSITVTVPGGGGGTPVAGSPSARFNIQTDSIGVAPLQVAFDPSDSEADVGRTLILFTWSFGDGDATSDVGASTKTHVFTTDTTSEVFSVMLLVLDNEGGNDSITKTVKAYNHRPVAGFETSNPPGGDTEGANTEFYANIAAARTGNRWEADDVVYGDLQALGTLPQDVTVVIRSKKIADARWFNLNGTLPQSTLRTSTTSAVTSTTPAKPTGYDKNNYSYDPEGQTWSGGTRPAWFPNQAWGIRYLYINWNDGSAQEQIDYAAVSALYGDDGVVVAHTYHVTVDGTVRTITVTAEDWLGYRSAAFSRTVTLKVGLEGTNDL